MYFHEDDFMLMADPRNQGKKDIEFADPNNMLFLYAAIGTPEDLRYLVYERHANVTAQDELLLDSPLHHAVEKGNTDNIRWLLNNGAYWSQSNVQEVTAGDFALREGFTECYDIIFAGAVKFEYEIWYKSIKPQPPNSWILDPMWTHEADNKGYMASRVVYGHVRTANGEPGEHAMVLANTRCTGVMMEWERPIMEKTARLLCEDMGTGRSILNVGFGLGIIDTYFQEYEPSHHTIIEGHPQCLAFMRNTGWFDKPNVCILQGRWQDFIGPTATPADIADLKATPGPNGVKGIGKFDVVYFDTFEERYQAHLDFLRCVPSLLAGPGSRYSFFHAHGRGWKMLYEVYAEVAKWHANDVGLNTDWYECPIPNPESMWTNLRPIPGEKQAKKNMGPYLIPISQLAPTTIRTVVPNAGWAAEFSPPEDIDSDS